MVPDTFFFLLAIRLIEEANDERGEPNKEPRAAAPSRNC